MKDKPRANAQRHFMGGIWKMAEIVASPTGLPKDWTTGFQSGISNRMYQRLALTMMLGALSAANAQTGDFTLTIGAAPIPPTALVVHSNNWRYLLGTNAPQADWKTTTDSALNQYWFTGPGGFGYEDGDDNTLLTTMSN